LIINHGSNMKYLSSLNIIVLVLFLSSCLDETPENVAKKYINELYFGSLDNAYEMLSISDKKTLEKNEFKKKFKQNPFLVTMSDRKSIDIKIIDKAADITNVEVKITHPDLKPLAGKLMKFAFASAFLNDKEKDNLMKEKAEKVLSTENLPNTTTTKKLRLVKENNKWRVFNDFEKQDKIEELLSSTDSLIKEKKLHAAKEEAAKILELDSEIVEAKNLVKNLDNKIKEFGSKQEYIKNIKLYDFVATRYDTYLEKGIPGVSFKLKNNGDKTLSRVEITVYFRDKDDNIIYEEIYNPVSKHSYIDSKPLKPGYISSMQKGTFYTSKSVPEEWQDGNAEAKITDIEFSE
jgi:hypothetical protein